MGFLHGKRALIVGLISDRSIAYGIADSLHREGAEIILTCQNEKLKNRVEEMGAKWNALTTIPCDVGNDEQITQLFLELKKYWDSFDILVHSVAYAPSDQLEGDYIDVINREGFRIAHDISSYSLAALAKASYLMMEGRHGSILTLSYLGSERIVPFYNVMGLAKASLEANVRYLAQSLGPKGIRINAISAGPIRTLAATGIKQFTKILAYHEKIAPLRKNVTIEDVGNTAAFLCSDLALGITATTIYVDAGYHAVASMDPDMEI